jgi:centromeric protein E
MRVTLKIVVGKTFSMTGTSAHPGIIPRAISDIFSIVEATAAQEKDVFFYVRLSFVELYNNTFR